MLWQMTEVSPLDSMFGVAHARPKRPATSDSVLVLLKKLIVQGDLRPGQRLPNERELAARLGVSRPSLREGIRALAAMNILDVRHGDGTFVSSLDAELLAEPVQLILAIDSSAIFALYEVRRITEPAAAALAAERATPDELELCAEEMERGIESQSDLDQLIEHDTRLHRLIHLAAHNPLLLSTSASLAGLARKARLRSVLLPHNAALTVEEHTAIISAIRGREPERAAAAMTAHLMRVENHLRSEETKAPEHREEASPS